MVVHYCQSSSKAIGASSAMNEETENIYFLLFCDTSSWYMLAVGTYSHFGHV